MTDANHTKAKKPHIFNWICCVLICASIIAIAVGNIHALIINQYSINTNYPAPNWWYFQFPPVICAYTIWIGWSIFTLIGTIYLISNLYTNLKSKLQIHHVAALTLLAVAGAMVFVNFLLRIPYMVNLPQMNIPDPITFFPYGTLFIDLNIVLAAGLCVFAVGMLFLGFKHCYKIIFMLVASLVSLAAVMMIRFGIGKLVDHYNLVRIYNLAYWMGLIVFAVATAAFVYPIKFNVWNIISVSIVGLGLIALLVLQIMVFVFSAIPTDGTSVIDMDKMTNIVNQATGVAWAGSLIGFSVKIIAMRLGK